MFTILITNIFLKGRYLLLLGLSDKESVVVSAVIKVVCLHHLERCIF